MKRYPKKIKRTVKVLTDPHPIFVSMVGHGANQTPFKTVKIADVSELAKKEVMKDKEPETVTKGAETPATEIHKIMFKGDKWKDAKTVEDYLTAKGYSNFKIEEDDGVFTVPAIDESAFDEVKAIKGPEDGVTMFVGALKDAAAKGDINITIRAVSNPGEKRQNVDLVAGANSIVTDKPAGNAIGGSTGPSGGISQAIKEGKEVPVTARSRTKSSKMTMAECLNEYNNGLPVGFYDASMAFASALRDIVSKGELKKISALAAEYGTLLQKLAAALPVAKSEERDAAIEKFFAVSKEEEVPSSDATKEQSDSPGEEEKDKEEETPPTTTETAESAESAIAEPEMVQKALEGALKPLTDMLKGMSEQVTKVANRVTDLERIRQTRKSLTGDHVAADDGKQNRGTTISRGAANLLGLSNSSRKEDRPLARIL